MEPGLDASTAAVGDLAEDTPQAEPVAVWDYLRQADQRLYVVLLRHALAPGTGDPANFQLGDCTTQRNLSEAGRQQASAIGQAFRQRGVTVDRVLSSQWCRCLETAELLELGPVEPFAPLNSFFQDRRTADSQTADVEAYLRQQPPQGVMVMVTHQVNITALTGIVAPSGQGVVVAVDGDQPLDIIGTLDPLAPETP
jgi:phosphohistidine phosphatase SixA